MEVDGRIRMALERTDPRPAVSVRLGHSTLLGQSLQGEMKARLVRNDIALDRLQLNGKGFAVQAAGRVMKGIGFSARVSDLALFGPSFKGSVNARGTMRKNGDLLSGSITARAAHLAGYGLKAGSLRADRPGRRRQGAYAPGGPFRRRRLLQLVPCRIAHGFGIGNAEQTTSFAPRCARRSRWSR